LLTAITYYHSATALSLTLSSRVRSTTKKRRSILPTTAAVLLHFLGISARVINNTFGNGRYHYYQGDTSSVIFRDMFLCGVVDEVLCAVVLGWAVLLASADQQRSLLVGEAGALLVMQFALTGPKADWMDGTQVRNASVVAFAGIIVAVLGIAAC